MSPRFGPYPVFVYEAITSARRWQGYALRALLVFAMLIALGVVWFTGELARPNDLQATRRFLAELGEHFYYGAAGIQLTLALLVAPAATAGAVCVDRASGWLGHMFVTDLSDADIVLGKFLARFASILTFVFAGVPMLAIVGLLGGIIPEALAVLTVVTLAVSLLGCSVAMALSTRASKPHEVLMVIFAIWSGWLLSAPLWSGAATAGIVTRPPGWFFKLNPFVVAYAPYVFPGYLDAKDVAIFVGLACLMSCATASFTVRRLRTDLVAPGQEFTRLRVSCCWIRAHLFSWVPSPSLDGNPVLWREWHRNRPSRMARLVSVVFVVGTILGMGIGIADAIESGVGVGQDLLEGVSLMAASFGLLILSATAPTTLTEERVRGSLDILMTTPLPTHTIVLGKWWATYRRSIPLVLLPALTGLFVAVASPDYPSWLPTRLWDEARPITTYDRVLAGVLPSAFLLAHAAGVTSFGLFLATWFRRTGRAVAASVAAFVIMSIGWALAVEMGIRLFLNWWSVHVERVSDQTINVLQRTLGAFSPMAALEAPASVLTANWNDTRSDIWDALFLALLIVVLAALLLLGLTLLTFNRNLGRMNESPELRRFLRARRHAQRPQCPALSAAEAS
jgi:ABC-type transport system involved in multi-copper enzyme maturation permease subunit